MSSGRPDRWALHRGVGHDRGALTRVRKIRLDAQRPAAPFTLATPALQK